MGMKGLSLISWNARSASQNGSVFSTSSWAWKLGVTIWVTLAERTVCYSLFSKKSVMMLRGHTWLAITSHNANRPHMIGSGKACYDGAGVNKVKSEILSMPGLTQEESHQALWVSLLTRWVLRASYQPDSLQALKIWWKDGVALKRPPYMNRDGETIAALWWGSPKRLRTERKKRDKWM